MSTNAADQMRAPALVPQQYDYISEDAVSVPFALLALLYK